MIVVEKTRDIGILKALGASRRGIMSIFLGYGLALGVVGSGVGVCWVWSLSITSTRSKTGSRGCWEERSLTRPSITSPRSPLRSIP
ncbi:MAG: hypothetical protein CM1200mP2_46090 [Planctomycetaceae bacterium]|nr:MAG: hypothetical protein CM1200mP2_46090 [Planctomycetaceae bacterium]